MWGAPGWPRWCPVSLGPSSAFSSSRLFKHAALGFRFRSTEGKHYKIYVWYALSHYQCSVFCSLQTHLCHGVFMHPYAHFSNADNGNDSSCSRIISFPWKSRQPSWNIIRILIDRCEDYFICFDRVQQFPGDCKGAFNDIFCSSKSYGGTALILYSFTIFALMYTLLLCHIYFWNLLWETHIH